MLNALRIENFAIVKHLELDFASGMTAFTGETGAGKSIMIDALMLAMGGRGDASVVRSGEEKCDITATFQFSSASEPAHWLDEQDIVFESGELILRRVIYAEGRSKSYINGQPFPLQKVKELSEMLVHIHGQHQHQTLMHHATHRQQLDHFANHPDLLQQVQSFYKSCQTIKIEIEQLQKQDKNHDKIELLRFQIEELSQLQLQDNEIDALSDEHQRLHHAHDYLHCCDQIQTLLQGEEEINTCHNLNQILQLLQELPAKDGSISSAVEMINTALIQCEEALDEVQQFADKVHLDPQRLREVEERLAALHAAARKYHVDIRHLPEHAKSLQQELTQLLDRDKRLEHLQQALQEMKTQYQQAALQLRQSRQTAAQKLADEISHIIRQLGMPKGKVLVDISDLEKIQVHGFDKVEYKVCTNPGIPPDSLSKIASGGELSRISLAIQMITAQRGTTPTLLFDEVDVGIGGATAALVGQLLRKLGERLQVFCVTHQPQVASCAHHHFLVEKYSDNEHTFSQILALNEDARIDEIARMLGGLKITDQTRLHARELLEQVH